MVMTELQSKTGLEPVVNDFCMTVCTVNGSVVQRRIILFIARCSKWEFLYLERIFSHPTSWVWQHGLLSV